MEPQPQGACAGAWNGGEAFPEASTHPRVCVHARIVSLTLSFTHTHTHARTRAQKNPAWVCLHEPTAAEAAWPDSDEDEWETDSDLDEDERALREKGSRA